MVTKRLLGTMILGATVHTAAHAQQIINENYVNGDPSGWTNFIGDSGTDNPLDPNRAKDGVIEVSTWQPGRIIDGTEAAQFPDPISGGNGPRVLTYDIRAEVDGIADGGGAGEQWDFFQKADRPINFTQDQFKSHVMVLEWSSFANFAASSTEIAKLEFILEDDNRAGLKVGNNWNTQQNSGLVRANQARGRTTLLETDPNTGEVVVDPQTGQPVRRDTLDAQEDAFNGTFGSSGIVDNVGGAFFGDGIEDDDGTPVLNTLFQQQAVVRLDQFENFQGEVEWRVENPDETGTPLWNTLDVVNMGSGTEAGTAEIPLGDLTNLRLQGTRRDVGGDPDAFFPDRVVPNDKIALNRTSTAGIPDNPDANQQVGLGDFALAIYHRGDLNKDGQVTVNDLTGSNLIANFGQTDVEAMEAPEPAPGDDRPTRGVVWSDGDTINDGVITVADMTAGILNAVETVAAASNGPAPTLNYDPSTGGVTIDTQGQTLASYTLLTDDTAGFDTGQYNGTFFDPITLSTVDEGELAEIDLLDDGTPNNNGVNGVLQLGNILPTGLSDEQFESFFTAALWSTDDPLSKTFSFFEEFAAVVPGDLNGDGVVDGLDIDPFVQVLTGGAPFSEAADINGDGTVDGLDIDPFVQILTGGSGQIRAIPEPTTAALLALGGLALTRRRRRG